MFRLKITPTDVLNMADAVMRECGQPEPAYHQRNGVVCLHWFRERNVIADKLMGWGDR